MGGNLGEDYGLDSARQKPCPNIMLLSQQRIQTELTDQKIKGSLPTGLQTACLQVMFLGLAVERGEVYRPGAESQVPARPQDLRGTLATRPTDGSSSPKLGHQKAPTTSTRQVPDFRTSGTGEPSRGVPGLYRQSGNSPKVSRKLLESQLHLLIELAGAYLQPLKKFLCHYFWQHFLFFFFSLNPVLHGGANPPASRGK